MGLKFYPSSKLWSRCQSFGEAQKLVRLAFQFALQLHVL